MLRARPAGTEVAAARLLSGRTYAQNPNRPMFSPSAQPAATSASPWRRRLPRWSLRSTPFPRWRGTPQRRRIRIPRPRPPRSMSPTPQPPAAVGRAVRMKPRPRAVRAVPVASPPRPVRAVRVPWPKRGLTPVLRPPPLSMQKARHLPRRHLPGRAAVPASRPRSPPSKSN